MSLEAYIWAASLRLDECDGAAFRVLLKYADRAGRDGSATWYKGADLADELGCSMSTIRRAIRELVAHGFLIEGDQRYVEHIPANYRPVVYDLATPAYHVRKHLEGASASGVKPDTTSTSSGVKNGAQWCHLVTHKEPEEPSYQDSHRHPLLVTARESVMSR